ncbi:hypothetical protein [Morganella morganii]|uniref:hypothetical protein n=1 Tax=Morganella morganii TaxID=582 RepID=UPI001A1966F8|nr:hypothetical protein [Morganella morganii]EKU4305119.1 hypothetical protein [Morganella morganii]HAT3765925.1 hypothetical protein [Morganella morganii]HBC7441670.1 hypothetical protein [Morganella morganii]HBN5914264.1 hypothetical protein [Morganella morganii]
MQRRNNERYINYNEKTINEVNETPKAKYILEFERTRNPRWTCNLYKLASNNYELVDSFSDYSKISGQSKVIFSLRPELGYRAYVFFNFGKQS